MVRLAFLWAALIPVSFAQGSGNAGSNRAPDTNCAGAARTPQEAMEKASWVVEGTVSIVSGSIDAPFSLIVDNTKVVYDNDPSRPNGKTVELTPFPCLFGHEKSTAASLAKARAQYQGKRLRFFGNRYARGPARRFFYVQPAGSIRPDIAKKKRADVELAHLRTTVHRHHAENPLPDGWHRARSTPGSFSIDLPGPFEDLTRGDGASPGFMLRATDQHGSTFMAVFEPTCANFEFAGTFDVQMAKAGATVTSFRGMPAVYTRGTHSGSKGAVIIHSQIFRVPGGTFMLGIVTSKENEAKSMQQKDRFFNSLSFK
jgi:hypothetical protein